METAEEVEKRIVDITIVELSAIVESEKGTDTVSKKGLIIKAVANRDCGLHVGKAMLWQRKEEEKE